MNNYSLNGKVSIVTGALGLIGKELCKALANAGSYVVVCDLDEEKCSQFAKELNNNSMGCYLDVTDKNSIIECKNNIIEKYSKIDVLVNNAAINDKFEDPKAAFEESKFENYPIELWEKSLKVNLTGIFLCCQIFGKEMVKAKKGSIINVASTYGIVAPDQDLYLDEEGNQKFFKPPAYSVTKGGVISLTKFLASYWGKDGIRVNTLSPGGVENNQDEYFIKKYSDKTMLKRMAKEYDYNGAIVFLASDASSYMTGANLIIDGGWTAW